MRSKRHTQLQNMTARWIGNRSFKMCGLPESHVVGYVADFVAIAGLHDQYHTRYANHSGLKKMHMSPRLTDEGWKNEIFGDIDRWYVCVFEVKVSRADFLNTFGKLKNTAHAKARQEPVGTAHWVVAEKGICKPEELPEFWGLLEPYGAGLTEKKMPKLNALPESRLHAFAFDMLWLSMNYRVSYYDQLIAMADKVKNLHRAIMSNKPTRELLRRSRQAMEACNGL